jgi:four helix bundle protein
VIDDEKLSRSGDLQALELALRVHRLTLLLPNYELYEEGSQVRRSSKSIASCIVEGYGRRRFKADFIKFLVYAHASCDETIVHLNFLQDTHRLEGDELVRLLDAYDELGRKINAFLCYVEEQWKPTRNTKPVTRNP